MRRLRHNPLCIHKCISPVYTQVHICMYASVYVCVNLLKYWEPGVTAITVVTVIIGITAITATHTRPLIMWSEVPSV